MSSIDAAIPEARTSTSEPETPAALAHRGDRLLAVLIDLLIAMMFVVPASFFSGLWDDIAHDRPIPATLTGLLLLGGNLWFCLVHGFLLVRYGQTAGKRVLKIRIADNATSGVPRLRQLVIRFGFMAVVPQLGFVGQLASMADSALIYRGNRRCIHDLLAGTRVVQVDPTGIGGEFDPTDPKYTRMDSGAPHLW